MMPEKEPRYEFQKALRVGDRDFKAGEKVKESELDVGSRELLLADKRLKRVSGEEARSG